MIQTFILNYFKPSLYVRSIKEINVSQLRRQGIKLFIADLDNTLVPHYTRLPNREVLNLIRKVQEAQMEFVIMSNNVRSRVEMFANKANVRAVWSAKKPFAGAARRLMKEYNVLPSEVVMVGDIIIFDTLLANRMKWESILVQPLVANDYQMSNFNLFLENRIYRHLERNNILRRNDFDNESWSFDAKLL